MEQITNEAVEKRAGGARLKKGGGLGGPAVCLFTFALNLVFLTFFFDIQNTDSP